MGVLGHFSIFTDNGSSHPWPPFNKHSLMARRKDRHDNPVQKVQSRTLSKCLAPGAESTRKQDFGKNSARQCCEEACVRREERRCERTEAAIKQPIAAPAWRRYGTCPSLRFLCVLRAVRAAGGGFRRSHVMSQPCCQELLVRVSCRTCKHHVGCKLLAAENPHNTRCRPSMRTRCGIRCRKLLQQHVATVAPDEPTPRHDSATDCS